MQRVRLSLIGVNTLFGKISSLLLKRSPFIKYLNLYDDDDIDSAFDVASINTPCKVDAFRGHAELELALRNTDIIVIGEHHCTENYKIKDVFNSAAPSIHIYAKAIASVAPKAIVVVAASPVNSMVPLVARTLTNSGCKNVTNVIGSTAPDNIRANSLLAAYLNVSGETVVLPVIGGSSPETRVPTFTYAKPIPYNLTQNDKDRIIDEIKHGEEEIVRYKSKPESLNKAYATIRFINSIMAGLRGEINVTDIALTRTTDVPGVDYFALPIICDRNGVSLKFGFPKISPAEQEMLNIAVQHLQNDISKGYVYADKASKHKTETLLLAAHNAEVEDKNLLEKLSSKTYSVWDAVAPLYQDKPNSTSDLEANNLPAVPDEPSREAFPDIQKAYSKFDEPTQISKMLNDEEQLSPNFCMKKDFCKTFLNAAVGRFKADTSNETPTEADGKKEEKPKHLLCELLLDTNKGFLKNSELAMETANPKDESYCGPLSDKGRNYSKFDEQSYIRNAAATDADKTKKTALKQKLAMSKKFSGPLTDKRRTYSKFDEAAQLAKPEKENQLVVPNVKDFILVDPPVDQQKSYSNYDDVALDIVPKKGIANKVEILKNHFFNGPLTDIERLYSRFSDDPRLGVGAIEKLSSLNGDYTNKKETKQIQSPKSADPPPKKEEQIKEDQTKEVKKLEQPKPYSLPELMALTVRGCASFNTPFFSAKNPPKTDSIENSKAVALAETAKKAETKPVKALLTLSPLDSPTNTSQIKTARITPPPKPNEEKPQENKALSTKGKAPLPYKLTLSRSQFKTNLNIKKHVSENKIIKYRNETPSMPRSSKIEDTKEPDIIPEQARKSVEHTKKAFASNVLTKGMTTVKTTPPDKFILTKAALTEQIKNVQNLISPQSSETKLKAIQAGRPKGIKAKKAEAAFNPSRTFENTLLAKLSTPVTIEQKAEKARQMFGMSTEAFGKIDRNRLGRTKEMAESYQKNGQKLELARKMAALSKSRGSRTKKKIKHVVRFSREKYK